jgi:endo-1,4-beta-D-glucanase Y
MVGLLLIDNNATDGDLDIAYALIQAEKLWPDSIEHYGDAAQKLLESIKNNNYSEKTGLLTVGNWATVDPKAEMLIRFSDIMPTYYKAFADFTDDPFWTKLEINATKALTQMSQETSTGLLPDFAGWGKIALHLLNHMKLLEKMMVIMLIILLEFL